MLRRLETLCTSLQRVVVVRRTKEPELPRLRTSSDSKKVNSTMRIKETMRNITHLHPCHLLPYKAAVTVSTKMKIRIRLAQLCPFWDGELLCQSTSLHRVPNPNNPLSSIYLGMFKVAFPIYTIYTSILYQLSTVKTPQPYYVLFLQSQHTASHHISTLRSPVGGGWEF